MRSNGRVRVALGIIGAMAAVTICVTAGHYLLSLLDLSGLWQTLFSLWIGFGLFAFTGFLIHSIGSRSRHEDHDMEQHGFMLEAMERIAQGDFSVFLPTDDRAHAKVAEAINTMAKNLGDMETMRQDFISNVSHEIQSPLTSIGGFAKLLKNDSLSPEQRKHYADIIETESNRLSSLSENLLKLSNLDNNKIPLNKADLKLDKQIESIVLTLEPQWSAKNINLEADIQKCAINGDRDLLSQVWINLLNNAIKFTPENGEITISLAEENGDVIVKIIDTGLGIAPEDKAHIFERFYKADKSRDRSFGGNGLGLSIVKKIVELHGGSITVESEKGKGTTFSVILPQK